MTITICGVNELLDKVAQVKPAAVLSIEEPGLMEGQNGYTPRLKNGTPQMILKFQDVEVPGTNGPDAEQIRRGIEFILPYAQRGENVIIHCGGGISRSTGVALGVLSALHPEETPEELINDLLALRPQAGPNIIEVAIADKLTGRHGTLLQAVLGNPQITAVRAELNKLREQVYGPQRPEKFPARLRAPKA